MRCSHCGTENPDHYSFCCQCGQSLAPPPAGLAVSPPASPPRGKKTLWIFLALGVVFLLLTAALGGIGYWGYKTWKDRQAAEYGQKEPGSEESEDELPGTAPRRSSGSKRISDAQYYEDRRQWDQAMAEYRLILKEDPNSYEAHYGLGNCYRKKLDLKTAVYEYQEALRLNPKYIPAYRALARIYARQNNLDAAVEQLEAAQRVDPKNPQVAQELAGYRKRRAQRPG